jgi:hypothetical protein
MFAFIKYLESLAGKLKKKKSLWFFFLGTVSFLTAILAIVFVNSLSNRYASDVYDKVKIELVSNFDTMLEMKQQQLSIVNDLLSNNDLLKSTLIAKKAEDIIPIVDIHEDPDSDDNSEDSNETNDASMSLEEIEEDTQGNNIEIALKEDLIKRKERANTILEKLKKDIEKSYGDQSYAIALYDKNGKLFAQTDRKNRLEIDSELDDSIQNTISSGGSTYGIDVEQHGVKLRKSSPVIIDNDIMGTIILTQEAMLLKKRIEVGGNKFAFLLHKDYLNRLSRGQSKNYKELIDDYYINPANYNSDFMFNLSTIDQNDLFENGYVIDDHFFITYTTIQNFKAKDIGIAIIGQSNKQAMSVISTIDSAVKNIAVIMLALVTSLFLLII